MIYRQQEERERLAQLRGPPKIDPDVAAIKIQKVCTHIHAYLYPILCAVLVNMYVCVHLGMERLLPT